MEKIDLKKELKNLYQLKKNKFEITEVPPLNYIMLDGKGDPNNSKTFQEAIEVLYGLAYTLKFTSKKVLEKDYTVMPLEGLWWTDDIGSFSMDNKSDWKWTLMILQPNFITKNMFEKAKSDLYLKKEIENIKNVRFECVIEGTCAQVLYIGAYSEEPPTIRKLHEFAKENGYALHLKHREIYLSDMRKTAPEKLKTIIRQPIVKL